MVPHSPISIKELISMTGPQDAAAVDAADARRFKATPANDIATLEALFDDKLIYTHSDSRRDDKASLLEGMRSGRVKYLKFDRQEATAHATGDTGIVSGRFTAEVQLPDGSVRALNSTFLSVWARRGTAWVMIAWQSTPVPAR
jgi:ketosteroid isomerase-like protein